VTITHRNSDITVRFAATDQDAVAIHRFLCVVAGPMLPGAIEAEKSIHEVWRVVHQECALMAMRDDLLVGTLGIIKPNYWWGNVSFLTNRWLFALPDSGAGKLLIDEGERIAGDAGLELVIIDEQKSRLLILNRDPRRKAVNPLLSQGVAVDPAPPTSHTIQ
jgi:hypothetical protein